MEILKLELSVKGEANSNIVLYQKSVLDQLAQMKTKDLVTDEDFNSAEKVVKICKEQEKALVDAKQKAQDESASIKDVFAAIDNAQNIFRDTRLGLERQIKTEKQNRKQDLIKKAILEYSKFKTNLLERYGFKHLELQYDIEHVINQAIKGKKNIESMQVAIDQVLGDFKAKFENLAGQIFSNIQIVKGRENQNLFPDVDNLAELAPDVLMAEINKREDAHKLEVKRIQEKELKEEQETPEKLEEAATPVTNKENANLFDPESTKEHYHNPDNPPPEEHNINGGFPKPAEQQDNFNNSLPGPDKFRIEINGSWELETTMESAKSIAGDLREKFGNCVTLSKL